METPKTKGLWHDSRRKAIRKSSRRVHLNAFWGVFWKFGQKRIKSENIHPGVALQLVESVNIQSATNFFEACRIGLPRCPGCPQGHCQRQSTPEAGPQDVHGPCGPARREEGSPCDSETPVVLRVVCCKYSPFTFQTPLPFSKFGV